MRVVTTCFSVNIQILVIVEGLNLSKSQINSAVFAIRNKETNFKNNNNHKHQKG
jgi:hypothetical protein